MRAIIIGAGRGSRLGVETTDIPKTMVQVMGRPMLDWILEALTQAGFTRKDVVFVCGYAQHVVRERYPEFTFVENTDWENNNILASLLYARQYLQSGFVSTYADIVYDGAIVQRLVNNPHDIVLGCDTAWRRRYVGRTQHPESDAEKLRAQGERVRELSRKIPGEAAQGEFIGVMKLSKNGASELVSAFDRARAQHAGKVWREGRTFEKAYLLDQLQDMLEQGSVMHREDTPGGYMEIDTLQDLSMAEQWWKTRS
ncbi:MAG TPA: phosphocholine cytidylyltransferase family protein [Polyangiaceae bacterium]